MNELEREAALREVAVKAVPVNDDDDLDALLSGSLLEEKAIAEITNMLHSLNELNNIDDLDDDWFTEEQVNHDIQNLENLEAVDVNQVIADRDRLQKELADLRSQHEFECEYVDQLEKEIISITNDRDRQVEDFDQRLVIALESESQKIAQQYLQELTHKTELINQLQCQNTALDISQQTLSTELEATQVLLKESTKTLEVAKAKLSEVKAQRDQFEEELIQHLSNRAQLQQSLRGLENEYVSDLTRVQELEQQIEELQNHVLQQASKASEYEAAIQHWKEQSVRHQHHALQLSGALERLLAERPVKHLTPISYPENNTTSSHDYLPARSPEPAIETVPVRSPRPAAKVDLPSFLVLKREAPRSTR